MAHPAVADTAVSLWQSLRASVNGALDDDSSSLWQRAEEALGRLGASLATDRVLQKRVDGWLGDGAGWVVSQYGRELSTVISHTIRKWDGQQASRKIELHVGRDLQYIRINGTIVGALAGIGIHALTLLIP